MQPWMDVDYTKLWHSENPHHETSKCLSKSLNKNTKIIAFLDHRPAKCELLHHLSGWFADAIFDWFVFPPSFPSVSIFSYGLYLLLYELWTACIYVCKGLERCLFPVMFAKFRK